MNHLRDDCNIKIGKSKEKKQLTNYGYFHGYKGYRFIRKNENTLPLTKFKEVVALIEYDNELKTMLYPAMMFLETALKNIICNESIIGLNSNTFETVLKNVMNDELSSRKIQLERLKLRNKIYSEIASRYKKEQDMINKMLSHFYDKGDETPIWAVFEILTLSETASYFECLNKTKRTDIMKKLGIYNISIDSDSKLLSHIIYTLKDLRNAIAHNSIAFDARFRERKINNVLEKWLVSETHINGINLESIVDYLIIVCCLLEKIDVNKKQANKLLKEYEVSINKLKNSVDPNVFNLVVPSDTFNKLSDLKKYLKKS